MTAAEMLQMGPEKLQQMLTTTTVPDTATEQTDKLDSKTSANPGTAGINNKKRSGNFENGGASGGSGSGGGGERYEQIRRRRGLTNFEVTESAVDPLRGVASVHDVVRISEVESGNAKNQSMTIAEENTLLCNYMPMVREYLDEEEKQNSTTTDDVMDTSTDGYVYDLYIEAEQQYPFGNGKDTAGTEDGDTNNEEDEDAWWEMHIRGGAPVVQIIDDDTWLVVEASDQDDTDESSEDSNAEDYYGNDYPDEEEDSEGGGGGVGGAFAFSSSDDDGGGGRRKKEWFDESDESDY